MVISVSIAVSRIIEECNIQTSLDLQAMRSRGVEGADAVYDDWVLTQDNATEVYYALQEHCADMAFYLRTLLLFHSAGRDVISLDIANYRNEPNEQSVVETMVRSYLKYRVLGWWYTNRDADLASFYTNKAATAIENLFSQCMPRSATAIGSYF